MVCLHTFSHPREQVLSIPEVVECIVPFLRQAHLAQLRLTNKTFCSAFSPYFTMTIGLGFHGCRKPPQEDLAKCGPYIKSLKAHDLGDRDMDTAEGLLDAFETLESVDIQCSGNNDALLQRVMETQPLLRRLTVTLSGSSDDDSMVQRLADGLAKSTPLLESLALLIHTVPSMTVCWSTICSVLDACPKLRHLRFRGFRFHNNTNEMQRPQVQSLVFTDTILEQHDIAFLLNALPELRSLSLGLYAGVHSLCSMADTEISSCPSTSGMPQLTRLKIGALWPPQPFLCRFIQWTCSRIDDLALEGMDGHILREDMLELVDHFKEAGITLKRLTIEYLPQSGTEDWIRKLLEECCPELQELRLGGGMSFFMDTQDVSYRWKRRGDNFTTDHREEGRKFWFPFASTLRTLHLNSQTRHHSIQGCRSFLVNEILRSMPLLVDLAIMDPLADFGLLQGLGRCVVPDCRSKAHAHASNLHGQEDGDRSRERPFLDSLRLHLAESVEFDEAEWSAQLVERFRFLERLSVKMTVSFPLVESLDRWQERLRPGLKFTLLCHSTTYIPVTE